MPRGSCTRHKGLSRQIAVALWIRAGTYSIIHLIPTSTFSYEYGIDSYIIVLASFFIQPCTHVWRHLGDEFISSPSIILIDCAVLFSFPHFSSATDIGIALTILGKQAFSNHTGRSIASEEPDDAAPEGRSRRARFAIWLSFLSTRNRPDVSRGKLSMQDLRGFNISPPQLFESSTSASSVLFETYRVAKSRRGFIIIFNMSSPKAVYLLTWTV